MSEDQNTTPGTTQSESLAVTIADSTGQLENVIVTDPAVIAAIRDGGRKEVSAAFVKYSRPDTTTRAATVGDFRSACLSHLEGVPNLPCAVTEMTARERAIYNIAARGVGFIKFLSTWERVANG